MESYFEDFIPMISHSQPSPMGGYIVTWTDGEVFKGVYIVDTSMQVRIAEAQGTKVRGRFATTPDAPIANNNYIRRLRDAQYFRIIGEPKQSPPQAESQVKYFDAEMTTAPPK